MRFGVASIRWDTFLVMTPKEPWDKDRSGDRGQAQAKMPLRQVGMKLYIPLHSGSLDNLSHSPGDPVVTTSPFVYRPQSRLDGLITTETESDLLIYDTERHELHTLNRAAASVWRSADGSKSMDEIAVDTGLEASAVEVALHQLTASGLLTNGIELPQNAGRRRLLKKGALITIPAIVSVSVPLAKAAASGSCPAFCPSAQSACCKNSDECKDLVSDPRGEWNCTGGGQVEGVPKGCCVRVSW